LHRFLLSFCFLLLIVSSAHGQQQAAETFKILGISVEGNSLDAGTDQGAIISNTGLRVGEEISIPGDKVRQAIQRLWALRIFSDVQILIENKVQEGIYLLIKVEEYPRLRQVTIRGADDVDEDDVRKKVNVVDGQILTPEDINRIIRSVKKLYEEENHLLAEVTPTTTIEDSSKKNLVTLELDIHEGPSVTIDRIRFAGNAAFSEDELKGEMDDISEKTWWQFWSSPDFNKDKYEKDKQRIVSFYRKNGYIDAEITGDSLYYSEDKKKISMLMTVREGAQYKIRSISWSGNTVYQQEILNERLLCAPGDIYNQEKFEMNLRGNQDQTDVASLYLDNGYLTFALDPEIKRVGTDSLDIIVRVYERNQFRVGKVDIKGNTKTSDFVIRRELFTRPGDFFNRSQIIRSLRQLSQLNYFNPEALRPDYRINEDGETVDLSFEVEEKSSDNVNASVGYSQAFGVTGALGFTINNFSIAEPLSGGAGQIFNFEWQFGEGARFRTFSLNFTEPWLYGRPTTLGVSLFDTRQIYTYDLRQTGVSTRVGRRLNWPDNYFRADWTFRFQNINVIDNGGNPFIEEGKTTQYSITQTFSRNSTDSPIFPSDGSAVSFSTEISGGPLLPGNVDYHKWLFSADWYTPLFGTNRLVLYTSTTLGYINGFESDSRIPPNEKFYMGGTGVGYIATTPLRGYEDRSIGPVNNAGQELGGNVLTKQTMEMRFALAINPIPIYILAFAEGGNVFADFKHADLMDLKRSYGFGARLLINPLGLIGFDYGYGADDIFPRDGKADGWKFHFQFGRGF
jgi:outer membrane protein insertion porin family